MIYIWSDGSGIFNEAAQPPIGYASVIRIDEWVIELAAWAPRGTNNTAELSAVIMGLHALNVPFCLQHGVTVITDSQYVIGQGSGKFSTNKNHALVKMLQGLAAERNVQWRHVRGHTGDWGNERCDVLAGWSRKQLLDPATQAPQLVHCKIYLASKPDQPLLDKATSKSVEVLLGDQCVTLKLLA